MPKIASLNLHLSLKSAWIQVFPSESSDGMERFSEMMDATKWEIHFSASRASEDELGCLEAQDLRELDSTWFYGVFLRAGFSWTLKRRVFLRIDLY